MPSKKLSTKAKPAARKKAAAGTQASDVTTVVATLKRMGSKSVRDGMARFAIPSDNAFGVPVGQMRDYAKRLGRNHDLAADLWAAGWYEARMLAAFVDDPQLVTPAQMDRWCRDFDSWAICDHACFHLFDRTPHAWKKINDWSSRKEEFVKRAAFATLWGLTVHDKTAADALFADSLTLIERAATDDRNFVKKAVNMALRAIGKRNAFLHSAALATAQRLAASSDPTSRWNGKDALRELKNATTLRRINSRTRL
jgi:3-methyladenine DNA glycosylase AlkD